MLQQTGVQTVGPYFRDFLARWPRIEDLAAASLDEILHAWQGLGYYARARNLHACAQSIARDHAGRFPETAAELGALPGVGGYTAAAIAAIAFDEPATVVDGNVERVVARLFAIETPLPAAKPATRACAATLTPERRAGDFAQAMMDLGAAICTPRRPRCMLCPLNAGCAAFAAGNAEALPRRAAKAARPVRRGMVFWLVRGGSEILIRRRPPRGLLGGLMELPSTEWRAEPWAPSEAIAAAPLPTQWRELPGAVRHVFTHFELELRLLAGRVGETTEEPVGANEGQGPRWCRLDHLSDNALPTLMKKVVAHALANGG
jgi:A/G-specific adenine glycosylase